MFVTKTPLRKLAFLKIKGFLNFGIFKKIKFVWPFTIFLQQEPINKFCHKKTNVVSFCQPVLELRE